MNKLLIIFTLIIVFVDVNLGQDKKNNFPSKPKITFIELGSVNCIPCKKMQPILKSIEEKYGTQIKVVFYDVWKDEYKKYSKIYNVKLIPTQVFLDDNGKEIFRHEGFYPENEIDKLFKKHGLTPIEDKK